MIIQSEPLEQRRLFAITLNGGVLSAIGDANWNDIAIWIGLDGNIKASLDGGANIQSFNPANVTSIVIDGLESGDDIWVEQAITLPTTIEGGSGDDSISGGGGTDSIQGEQGVDTLSARGFSSFSASGL